MPSSTPTPEEIATARAQLIADELEGNVPPFSTTDETVAQTFVDYINGLIPEKPTIQLVTKTTYSISKL